MNILQIIPSISLVYGGPSQMVLGLSEALATAGINVTIITTNSNGDTGQKPLDVPLQVPIEMDNYTIIYFPCSPFRRYKFSFNLLQWLNNNYQNYDVAHIHALFSPVSTFAATICRWRGLPYILRPLGTLDPLDLQKKKLLKQIYGNLLEKPNLKGAARVHFTSGQEATISERFGVETEDLIIPLGVKIGDNLPVVNTARTAFNIPLDVPLILFMSRIDSKKGLDLLIPALEILLDEGLSFHFVLAGNNPQDQVYEDQIKEEIKGSKLNNCTTITGFITGEMKSALLQDADLFVLPSYYENFGIAVAEALIYKIPVVISNQVYIWEDVKKYDAGWICDCDVASLQEQLKLALNNDNLRREKGKNGAKLAREKYSWGAIAQNLIQVYDQVKSG
jgi:glycosyltransferase involved in cell wall biosynthesis